MSTERPILFSGPMVRAILEDRKTQTRRVVKPQPVWIESSGRWWWAIPKRALQPGCSTACVTASREWHEYMPPGCCPYGQPGDLLWVREMFRLEHREDFGDYYIRHAGLSSRTNLSFCNLAGEQRDHLAEMAAKDRWWRAAGRLENGDPLPLWLGRWRPSIHMPKWACRLWLRVEDVRVERLQEISEEDARAEGVEPVSYASPDNRHLTHPYRDGFASLWDFINGKRAPWKSNPWVWAVTFSRTEAPDA